MIVKTIGAKRLLVLLILVVAACAKGPNQRAASPPSSKIITADELSEVFQFNALQAVELLRPNWLRNRGPVTMESSSSQGVRVYVDGNPRGFASDLEGILASDIREMRFLDSREATTRYGTGYPDGVIVVVTRQQLTVPGPS